MSDDDARWAADEATLREAMDVERFLESIAQGVPPILAGIEVDWTPRQTEARLADPEFKKLVDIYMDMSIDSVEKALHKLATGGHLGAIQMVLYNRRPDKWRDQRRVEIRTEHAAAPELVMAAREAIMAALNAPGGIAALQPGGALDAIETTASE